MFMVFCLISITSTSFMSNTLRWFADRLELRRQAGNSIPSMEGLRGFAVILVFFVHFFGLAAPWIPADSVVQKISKALFFMGNSGVDLFFVLSGYLIYDGAMRGSQNFAMFIWKRVRRIYPTFTVVFFIYLALSLVAPAYSKLPQDSGDAIVYLIQNYLLLPGLFPIEPMIAVAWSLSYELFYYIAAPVMVTTLRIRRWQVQYRVIFFMLVALLGVLYSYSGGQHMRLILFISGILVRETVVHMPDIRLKSGMAFSALAFALMAAAVVDPSAPREYTLLLCILFSAFYAVCSVCFIHKGSGIARYFSWTPLRWLGNMSYSYYLIHGLALKFFFMAIPAWVTATYFTVWALLIPSFITTVVAGFFLYLTVEHRFSLRR